MAISIHLENLKEENLETSAIPGVVSSVILGENKTEGEISIILCTDEYLLDLNKKYISHDYYTDIITFDYSENNIISGDLFISVDRVSENANEYGVSFINELKRVAIHGILHLAGYNDKEEEEKNLMRKKEDEYLV